MLADSGDVCMYNIKFHRALLSVLYLYCITCSFPVNERVRNAGSSASAGGGYLFAADGKEKKRGYIRGSVR